MPNAGTPYQGQCINQNEKLRRVVITTHAMRAYEHAIVDPMLSEMRRFGWFAGGAFRQGCPFPQWIPLPRVHHRCSFQGGGVYCAFEERWGIKCKVGNGWRGAALRRGLIVKRIPEKESDEIA